MPSLQAGRAVRWRYDRYFFVGKIHDHYVPCHLYMQVVPFAGDATVFVSHCWGATWGDMVLAAASGARVARVVGSPTPPDAASAPRRC